MRKFYWLVVISLFFSLQVWPIISYAVINDDLTVTLKVKKKPLGDVVKQIQLQTGYMVKLDDDCSQLQVTGFFHSVSVETFLKRVLTGHNIFVVVDDEKRLITVRQAQSLSGDFTGSQRDGKQMSRFDAEKNAFISNPEEKVLGTDLTLKDLEDISVKNAEIYEASKINSNEIVFGTTLTRAQLDAIGRHNKRIYEAALSNQQATILGTTIKESDIKNRGMQNFELYNAIKSDPSRLVFGTNMTVAELNAFTVNK